MTLATMVGYLTGLAFVAPQLDVNVLLGTALAMHVCYAIMCRLIAHNNGHPKGVWTVVGFIAGLWAVAVLILLPRRAEAPRPPHPFA